MFCPKCGKEIMDEAVICPHCGCSAKWETKKEYDFPSPLLTILAFLLPIIGLIIYFVYKKTCPQKAISAWKGALIGIIFCVIALCISAIIATFVYGNLWLSIKKG